MRKSFLVLFFKKEQKKESSFLKKKKQKTFAHFSFFYHEVGERFGAAGKEEASFNFLRANAAFVLHVVLA
jgi:hypothetical protein